MKKIMEVFKELSFKTTKYKYLKPYWAAINLGFKPRGIVANFANNADNPTQLEHGRQWKSENNAGCCPSCTPEVPDTCTTIISRNTRVELSSTATDCGCNDGEILNVCQDNPVITDCSILS